MSYIPSLTLPSAIFKAPAISILLPIAGGFITGFTGQDFLRSGYQKLKKPPLNPPNWIFGPVWTLLYGMMGYAAYRAWSTGMASSDPLKVEDARRGATLYTVQLALNFLWMPLFFTLRQPVAGVVDIIALDASVVYLAYVWSKVDSVAAYCLLPYVGWLGFATYLSLGLGHLNRWDFKSVHRPKVQ